MDRITQGLELWLEARLLQGDSEQSLRFEQAHLGCSAENRLSLKEHNRESIEEATALPGPEAGVQEAVGFCKICQ